MIQHIAIIPQRETIFGTDTLSISIAILQNEYYYIAYLVSNR